ncbi:non-ribosomal peptide synthetase [Marinobacter salarius]|uniref:Linear gramicidin synthase subunit B n=1 Tax=Marinobacter salarius TaxID=1420917 RepID=A0A1W6KD67_9GAMM|nr:non-ribosomal peptide synthetase [Marinobacter salarius]ARM85262.1 linear gramicidin synthase subunit B [Marinobacter salarius]
MSLHAERFPNFADVLRFYAEQQPQSLAIRQLVSDDAPPLVTSYSELYQKAQALAGYLQNELALAPGERCLLMLPGGADFAAAFFGCFYAGIIAIPAYPPEHDRQAYIDRLGGMIGDSKPMAVLALEQDIRRYQSRLAPLLPDGGRVVAADRIGLHWQNALQVVPPQSQDLAFLQYTSGSTSAPKGVMVSHANLMANEYTMAKAFQATDDDVWMTWLPLFHDMGLMSGLLLPILHGHCANMMTPQFFLARPARWLEAISQYRVTYSGGPDFAYMLCGWRVTDEQLEGLDLSSWRLAFTGSEPIRPETLERFADRMAPHGFRSDVFAPSYGLAEATLFVTTHGFNGDVQTRTFEPEQLSTAGLSGAHQPSRLVGCGDAYGEDTFCIVDSQTREPVEDGRVGEIWISGPSVAQGYWEKPTATAETFVQWRDSRWLRSGDLGIVEDGHLYVAGRQKDVIIVNGQNLYPQDIESTLEREIELLMPGRLAAFATTDARQAEGIGLALEVGRTTRRMIKPAMICATIAETMSDTLGIAPQVILLLEPKTLPRTTSGKLQRAACRQGWERGELSVFAGWQDGRMLEEGASAPAETSAQVGPTLLPEVVAAWQAALERDDLDSNAHFFTWGGDSVGAMQMLSRVERDLGLTIEPAVLFEHPRLGDFSRWVSKQSANGQEVHPITLLPDDAEPLQSFAQQRLWFLGQLEGGSSAYHLCGEWQFMGSLDEDALQRSLDALAERHESLRTVFAETDENRGLQRIQPAAPVTVQSHDLSGEDSPASALDNLSRALVSQPMDLEQGPLWQVHRVRLGDSDHRLLMVIHHIIADGWSAQVLVKEFAQLYTAFAKGHDPDLPVLPIRYADYAHWHRETMEAGEAERQLSWWEQQLGDEHPVLELPTDRPRPESQSHRGARVAFAFPEPLSEKLRQLARDQGVTLFMVMLALYKTQLYRYSGQRDLRIGVPVSGRSRPETEGLVGLFVNTLVLRSQPVATQGFTDFLASVRDATLGAQAHADLPFEQLVDALQPERNLRHNPLCQVKFTQQFPLPENVGLPGATLTMRQRDDDSAHFDLGFDITDQPGGIEGTEGIEGIKGVLTYACDLFDEPRIREFAEELVNLAEQVTANPSRPLGELELLATPSALEGPKADFPVGDLVSLWNGHIQSTIGQQALQYEDQSFDYGWLEAESNRLAQHLQRQGVAAESSVGLCLDRSPEFVVGVLAVLKAGGAFVPLDPKWPSDRQAFVLKDCGAGWLLGHEAVPGFEGALIGFNAAADWRSEPVEPLGTLIEPAQAAYLIYTSGTSGTPKGVVVSHGAIANYVQGVLEVIDPSPKATMAMVSTVAADLGHTTLFGALCSGRTLHLLSADRVMDADAFASYMAEHQVDILKIVPTHLSGLLQAAEPARVLPREALVLGGEALPSALLSQVRELNPDCRVFNHYGPSESTVGVLTTEPGDEQDSIVPLGTPLPNIRAQVLSEERLPLPQGAIGELYLSGAGLARGYLGQPEQTAAAFVDDPQSSRERLYATGDRVRLLEDGRLSFHGRNDDQVKVRGYRVSLGEIAQRIRAFDGVSDAHVQVDDNGLIMAYPLAVELDTEAMLSALALQMPDYMVPAHILPLAEFPLTPNGKLDRKALPQPERPGEDFAAPLAGVETMLAELWQSLLHVERVGRHDNFFSLGGDSIISLQVIARARKQGVKLTPKQLFEKQTIAELAHVAEVQEAAAAPKPAARESVPQAFPLTPIQQRFFNQPVDDRNQWNQALRLGIRSPLEAEPLSKALAAVVDIHPALRLRFDADQRTQTYSREEKADLLWTLETDDEQTLLSTFNGAQRSLDLSNGPLLRCVLVSQPGERQELLIAAHHLAVDGVSWRVLLEDLQFAYEQAAGGRAIELEGDIDGLHDWVHYLHRDLAHGRLDEELAYWQAFSAEDAALPCDNPDGTARVADGDYLRMTLDEGQTQRLLNDVPTAFRTRINDLLLAALAQALGEWSGRSRHVITLEGHGRNAPDGAPDVSRTVGWFTTLYPVALEAGEEALGTLKRTKEMLRQVPGDGLGYGVLKELQGAELPEMTGAGLTFNYLGRFDEEPGSQFVLEGKPVGDSRHGSGLLANALVVDGQVRNGQLQLDWTYSRARFEKSRVTRLIDLYREALMTLIEDCASRAGGLTPSDVPLADLDQPQLDALENPANIEDILPLAPMQEGILLHSLLEQGSGIYLMQDQYEVRSEVDFEAFRAAWHAVVQRHPMLRTAFHGLDGGTQHQIVYRDVPSPAQLIDLSHLERADAEAELEALLAAERRQGFDFTKPPLLRLRLVRFGQDDCRIVQSHHHALIDAWCRGLMLAEFFDHYSTLVDGKQPVVTPARPYRDFIAWLQRQDAAQAHRFWRDNLVGFTEVTPLPYQRTANGEPSIQDVTHALTAEETAQLVERARDEKLTVNTFMQAAWALVLMRHGGLDEALFGVTVAGRPAELDGIEDTLGLFINTLPLRIGAESATQTGLDFLRSLQSANAALRQYEHLSLAEVQNLADTPRGDALFDSLFVFENVPMGADVRQAAEAYGITPLANRTHTNYPLTVVILPGETYQLQFSYDQRYFRDRDMQALLDQYHQVLRQLMRAPEQPLAAIQLVSAGERGELLGLGQGQMEPDWMSLSWLERFEAWALADPGREVARCQGSSMSYAELNQRANRIGHSLIEAGTQPDQVVALYSPRNLDLMTMIVGAFKAGGAYLALDERHPPARSGRMLHSSQAPVLVTPEACLEQVGAILAETEARPRVVTLESLLATDRDGNPRRYPAMDQLAYVIYTSGSTGEPKGVMVNQQGMLNNQLSKVPYLELGDGDVIAQTAATGFDISVWQFLTAPLFGGRLDIIPDEITHDPQRLLEAVADSGVTVLESVPAVIEGILAVPERRLGLRWLLPTGEALGRELARRWFERYPRIPLVNAYGPAECADDVALHTLTGLEETRAGIPIGKPTDNNRLYVLDTQLELAPSGVVGELYVGGTGVGRGYAGRPELTAERYVPDPFGQPGGRLYRTGDLARWNDDGLLEYAGRADFQVKIRGQRIEPGEIESCLLACNGIRQAVVAAQQTPHGAQLVAYLVPDDGLHLETESLRDRLSHELPAVMVPTHLVVLDRLPLNANGKLDRKSLPQPELEVRRYIAPEGELEEILVELWRDLLKVEQVGRHDHFFELGGHSLLATRLLSRIRERLGVSVPLAEAFEATTVAAMAAVIERLKGQALDQDRLDNLDALMNELEEIE